MICSTASRRHGRSEEANRNRHEIHERSSGLLCISWLQFLADKLRARANPFQKSAHRQAEQEIGPQLKARVSELSELIYGNAPLDFNSPGLLSPVQSDCGP